MRPVGACHLIPRALDPDPGPSPDRGRWGRIPSVNAGTHPARGRLRGYGLHGYGTNTHGGGTLAFVCAAQLGEKLVQVGLHQLDRLFREVDAVLLALFDGVQLLDNFVARRVLGAQNTDVVLQRVDGCLQLLATLAQDLLGGRDHDMG